MLLAHGESPNQAAATLSYPGAWGNSRVIQHGPRSPRIKDAELAANITQTVHIYHLCVIRKALKLHTHTHAHLQLWGQTQMERSMLWPLFLQTSSHPFPLDSTTFPTSNLAPTARLTSLYQASISSQSTEPGSTLPPAPHFHWNIHTLGHIHLLPHLTWLW